VSVGEEKRNQHNETDREAMMKTLEEMYGNGRVPTIMGIMRMFGLQYPDAMKLLADFHARYPMAMPITFTVMSKNPLAFWGMIPKGAGGRRRPKVRYGPPGLPLSHPYRRQAIALLIASMAALVAGLLLGYYGGY
jgi:hypothetical protein